MWATVALLGLILAGVLVIVWLDRWRKDPGGVTCSASDQLARFRDLHQRGELSSEEFDRIRMSLEPRLRVEMNLPPAPTTKPSPEPSPPTTPAEPGGGQP
jgi:hypothetical protein